ncbi:MAG: kelch repeat-containing protein [Deltaproteobacteria bacterium]|nr:kelch repeat-containing protein [Deltaproteobacteria bacterium]
MSSALACLLFAASCDDGALPSPVPAPVPVPVPVPAPPPTTSSSSPAPIPSVPGEWRPLPPLPVPQQENAVVALAGKVYVIGGFGPSSQATTAVAVFDPRAGAWSAAAPLPEAIHHVNAAVVGDRIFVVGGLAAGSFGAIGTTLAYDPQTNVWTRKTSMPAGTERGSSFVGAIGNVIYVAGGLRTASVADVSSYDTTTDTWSGPLAPLEVARDHGMSAVVSGKLLAIGGRAPAHFPRVDAYDPEKNAWTPRAPMPTSRAGGMAALVKGLVVVAGGENNAASADGMFGETEAYDPSLDRWLGLPRMRTPRHGTGAAAIDGVVYVPGGGTVPGFGQTAIFEALYF